MSEKTETSHRIKGPFLRLGEGAFGEVLEAFDSVTNSRVAIKRIFMKSSWAVPSPSEPPVEPYQPIKEPSPVTSPRSVTVKEIKSSSSTIKVANSKLELSIDGLSLSGSKQKAIPAAFSPSQSPSPTRKRALVKHPLNPEDGGFFSLDAFRELQSLKHLQCENIVELRGYYLEPGALVLILERLALDLGDFLNSLKHKQQSLPEDVIVTLAEGILRGLEHCHSNGVMHRDIKPSNILLSEHGAIKLADFGIARPIMREEAGKSRSTQTLLPSFEYTNQVSSRWYRAPEVLFGATRYGPAIDVWAAGLIIAELFNGEPLVPGGSDIEQLARVLAIRGTPLESTPPWKGAKDLPDFKKVSFKPTLKPNIQSLVPKAPQVALDLIDSLLTLDPARRPSAAAALTHPFFQQPHAPLYEIASIIDEALKELGDRKTETLSSNSL